MPGPLIAYDTTAKVPQPGTVTHTAFSAGLFIWQTQGRGGNLNPFPTGMARSCSVLRTMARDFSHKFYHTGAWINVRGYVFHRDQMLCQDCLKKGLYTPAEEVHHIVELTPSNINDPNIALNPDNLISLCRSCHAKRHERRVIMKRYTIDEDGKVTIK